jgi:hypothetical protein
LLDMHPVPPSARVERAGESLGEFDDAEFFKTVAAAEAGLAETGLFGLESELEFEWLERYDSAEDLLADAEEWQGCRVPPSVAARVRQAEPPVDIWEQVVLRRFGTL